MLCFSSMSSEAWLLLLVWNSACDHLAQKQGTFCICFKLICGKFFISPYLFHYALHLTYVLIPNILAKNSSLFSFIRVILCCKCQNDVQCSVISNYFYKVPSPKENHVKKEGTFSDQSGDAMYAFIYFTKYKSSCWLVFFKITVLEIFQENQNIPVMEYYVSNVAALSAI